MMQNGWLIAYLAQRSLAKRRIEGCGGRPVLGDWNECRVMRRKAQKRRANGQFGFLYAGLADRECVVWIDREEPLFENYAFIRPRAPLCDEPWWAIERADGIGCLLRMAGSARPVILADEELAALCAEAQSAKSAADADWLMQGLVARICAGPLAALKCVVAEVRGERVKVDVGNLRVDLQRNQLEPA